MPPSHTVQLYYVGGLVLQLYRTSYAVRSAFLAIATLLVTFHTGTPLPGHMHDKIGMVAQAPVDFEQVVQRSARFRQFTGATL